METISSVKVRPAPNQADIRKLYSVCRECSDCTPEVILLFIAAFMLTYTRGTILPDNGFKQEYLQMIALYAGISCERMGSPISSAKWHYEKTPSFRRKVDGIVSEVNRKEHVQFP